MTPGGASWSAMGSGIGISGFAPPGEGVHGAATTVDIEAACQVSSNVYMFRATGSVLKFPGFRTLYLESRDDGDDDDNRKLLPVLTGGDALGCLKLESIQHFTQPPPRFTEATLIKAMEEKGIGRPSTYAPTIGTLLARNYVEKDQTRLMPTTLSSPS